ncbi:hypothetical protein [Prevotella sp. KH2C16]|uniref:hypothetical protein n=1 Tax=Prevotella sp. KH2C16 TaxID=1855325 RepID=UPI0008ED3531|nr:hypothetical protein [Prevotella sp. KH2C16]SFG57246.1 hypothetical protein SAMN05216383_12081 [Prevotella sp. KH2C16]
MLIGQLKINGKDAYTTWGVSMDDTSLSALMTPPSVKAYIENNNRTEHGKRVITTSVFVDSRDLTLQINLTANDEQQFFERYASFCEELAKGILDIETSFQQGIVYHCLYQSCSQFSQFMRGIGKFVLKLTEPNPNKRN